MSEKKALPAVLTGKCPRCRQGDMFKYSLLHITKFSEMHDDCPHCGHHFEEEPGFFIGAMYVSYAFSVAILLNTVFVLYYVFGDPDLSVYLISVVAIAVLLFPFSFRYSRILYIYLFGSVKYHPEESK